LNFEHLNFVFVSDFDIRISDLLVLSQCHSGQANFLLNGMERTFLSENMSFNFF